MLGLLRGRLSREQISEQLSIAGIPEDSTIESVYHDHSKDCFSIRLKHPSFHPVHAGDEIPIITAHITRKDLNYECKFCGCDNNPEV